MYAVTCLSKSVCLWPQKQNVGGIFPWDWSRHFASLTERSVLVLVRCWTKAAHPVNIQLYIHEISSSSRVLLLNWDILRLSLRGFVQVSTVFWGSVHRSNITAAAERWVSFFFSTFGPVRTDYLTHTWWGGVCGVMQSRGTKRLKFRRALRLIRDTTVLSLTWKWRVFVLKPRVKLKHLRQPNILFISHLYFNLPFQFSFLSHRFGHYSSHSKDFFDVSSFVGFSIKMCCFHSVDLMADGQEAVLPSQSFLWAVPSMFFDQRHTKLIR